MFYANLYMRKKNEKDTVGWSNAEVYESVSEFKAANPEMPILLPLDSGYFVAKHPLYVFPTGTNITSVSTNEKTSHTYSGYDTTWVAGYNLPSEHINFDELPSD